MVRIPRSHRGDRGSIPLWGALFLCKCILCGYPENSIEHVVNDCKKLCRERRKTLEELNKIDNTNYKKLLKAIEYHYYSKKYTNGKEEKKSDKKGVKIIKEFLLEMYKKFGAVKKKNDDE